MPLPSVAAGTGRLCECGCGTVWSIPAAVNPPPPRLPPRNPQRYFEGAANLRFTVAGTQQRAIQRGQAMEIAKPDVLQLDIDGPEAYTRFGEMVELYQSCDTLPALGKIVERDSRTPGNKHITIELPTEYPVETRIMLQALLGSDLKRELLSLASHHNGHEDPILFYRPQEEVNASTQAGPRDGADRNNGRSSENAPRRSVAPRERIRRGHDELLGLASAPGDYAGGADDSF